jgi:photoactive yellow protein
MASSPDDFDSPSQAPPLTPRPKSDVPIPDRGDADDTPALSFDAENIGEQLRDADKKTLNEAPFGIVRLTDEGRVEFYNHYESTLSGVPPDEAVGQDFFAELAPCSNNHLFLGRFREGVAADDLDAHFTYTFTYKMRPTLVDIRLYRDEAGQNWVFIQKR